MAGQSAAWLGRERRETVSIRLNITEPTEEGRAELARLQQPRAATYLDVRVQSWLWLAVLSTALGLGLAVSGLLPQPQQSADCELLYVEPSGPEPSVTVWHSHWDCSGEWRLLEYVPALQWECGAVWEEGRWLEAACDSEEELASRLAQIRAEGSGERRRSG